MTVKHFYVIEKDDYDLYMWLKFLDKKELDCKACLDLHIDHDRLPDCLNKCLPIKKLLKNANKTLEERRLNECLSKSKNLKQ